jgi:hypothetical protein
VGLAELEDHEAQSHARGRAVPDRCNFIDRRGNDIAQQERGGRADHRTRRRHVVEDGDMMTECSNIISFKKYQGQPPRKRMSNPVEQVIYRGMEFHAPHYVPWAKIFDADGIRWAYRPEVDEEGGYLVDFLLPDVSMFVIVWADVFFFQEVTPHVCSLVKESGLRAFVTVGTPGDEQSMLIERGNKRIRKQWRRWASVVGELRAAGKVRHD